MKTNPNCMSTLGKNTIYTNVAVTPEGEPWWEGHDQNRPEILTDWKGNAFNPTDQLPAAHPNARFTVPASQCPSYSAKSNSPEGVPISAIIFGGRRSTVAPLVYETFDWVHGVFAGASMASETTAAASGQIGKIRRDPMAMKPFCGYNFGDYWSHWLSFAGRSSRLPPIFHVNWFRKDGEGKYLWPGFGENIRVLDWILRRCEGSADAHRTPIGYVPTESALNLSGISVESEVTSALLSVDKETWALEIEDVKNYFDEFGEKVPSALLEKADEIKKSFN